MRRKGVVVLKRAIGVGVLASLAGTLVMDLVMAVEFVLEGRPAWTYLDQIGSVFGGRFLLGVLAHVLLAAALGMLFVLSVLKVRTLRIDSPERGAVMGFFAGLASISLSVPFALLISEPVLDVVAFSNVPHLAWGIVAGLLSAHGLKRVVRA